MQFKEIFGEVNILSQNEDRKQKLTMIELFSGIGAQKQGTDLTGLFDLEVVATADIEKDAMVSYASIHNGLTNEMVKEYSDYPSEEQMRKELMDKNIGFDFKKGTNPIARVSGEKLKKYYLAMIISKNLGDISKIAELPLADFWTYSFPCQDISIAGKQAGIVQGETRSGLLYEVERLLTRAKESDTLPKYLLLENVKNLVGKQFKEKFGDWISRLDELGFNTYWSVVNAKDCGVTQNRDRVFAVSIRKDVDTKQFEFMKSFDLGLRLRDFLEESVDEKYYITNDKVKKMLNSSFIQEKLRIQTSDVCNRKSEGIAVLEKIVCEQRCDEGIRFFKNDVVGTLRTIDSCGDKRVIENALTENIRVRKLTPRECFRLMGFSDECYDKALSVGLSDSAGYKQAGNSIVTYCIKGIMEHLYKAQYDNTYICFDEQISSEKFDLNEISVVGNYMPSNHDASRIVDENGISPCVKENHGTVTGVLQRNFTKP